MEQFILVIVMTIDWVTVFALQVLDRLSFGKSTLRGSLVQEGRIAIFWYYLTYLALKRTRPRYQEFEALPQPTPLEVVSQASGKSPKQFSADFVDDINKNSADEVSTKGLGEDKADTGEDKADTG